jgi:hypothetical protein
MKNTTPRAEHSLIIRFKRYYEVVDAKEVATPPPFPRISLAYEAYLINETYSAVFHLLSMVRC